MAQRAAPVGEIKAIIAGLRPENSMKFQKTAVRPLTTYTEMIKYFSQMAKCADEERCFRYRTERGTAGGSSSGGRNGGRFRAVRDNRNVFRVKESQDARNTG